MLKQANGKAIVCFMNKNNTNNFRSNGKAFRFYSTNNNNNTNTFRELVVSGASFDKLYQSYQITKQKKIESAKLVETCLVMTHKCKVAGNQNKELEECLLDLSNFLSLLNETDEEKINEKSWNFAIQHFLSHPDYEQQGIELYERIVQERRFSLNYFTFDAMLKHYSKIGNTSSCGEIINILLERGQCTVYSFISLISSMIKNGQLDETITAVVKMQQYGVEPNFGIYIPILKEATRCNNVTVGMKLYEIIKKSKLESMALSTTIITFFSRCGKHSMAIDECKKLQQGGKMDLITWTCLIQSFIEMKNMKKAIQSLYEMIDSGIQPDRTVFNVLITACGNSGLFEEGKQLHLQSLSSLRNITTDLHNSIIAFYTKCGRSDIAIQEFMKMKNNGSADVISWTCLIQAYLNEGNLSKSIGTLSEMQQYNIKPSYRTFLVLITACANRGAFKEGEGILRIINSDHSDVVNVELVNSIINFYTKCGHGKQAIQFFEKYRKIGLFDSISWNCVIQAHLSRKDYKRALMVLGDMERNHSPPDCTTYTLFFSAFGENNLYLYGAELVKTIPHELLVSNTLVNSLMTFYTKCGHPELAIEEFDKLKEKGGTDIVSWNCLIQACVSAGDISKAIQRFEVMPESNVSPDDITFTILMKGCTNNRLYEEGMNIHSKIPLFINKNITNELATSIMNFYTKCGRYEKAIEVFNNQTKSNQKIDITLYNCLIQAYVSAGEVPKAIQTYNFMQENKIVPDGITFTILMKGCAENGLYKEGMKIHSKIPLFIKKNITIELATSIMNFYTKCGKPHVAVELYHDFSKEGIPANVVIYTALMQAFIEMDDVDGVFTVLNDMMKQNIQPSVVTYVVLLQACSRFVSTDKGSFVIKLIQDNKMDTNETIKSSIALYYSKIGELETSEQMFMEFVKGNKTLSVESCNNLLSIYAHHGKGSEAFDFYNSMRERGIEPTEKTFTILLNALSHSGMIKEAETVFSSIKYPSIQNKCAMVDALARKGMFQQAERIIDSDNNYMLWNALMSGCRKFNNLELGERVFKTMIAIDDTEPSAYLLLSHIYMYYGLVEKANYIREQMKQKGLQVMSGIVYHEEDGIVYKFVSGSEKFDKFEEVEQMRDEIFRRIIEAGYVPDTRWVTNSEFKTEDEKVKALCRHAEKTAIAHAFVLNRNRKKIVLTKNLRICNDCHSATAFISKVMDCEIIVRDAKRFHHFKNGHCSCEDYW